jgi:hypothetical protein
MSDPDPDLEESSSYLSVLEALLAAANEAEALYAEMPPVVTKPPHNLSVVLSRQSDYNDDRILERFAVDSSLVSSTDSVNTVSDGGDPPIGTPRDKSIKNLHQVQLSRNLFNTIRGGFPGDTSAADGCGMPTFTVVSVTGSDPMMEPAPSPRQPGNVLPLVRGEATHTDEVWHSISTGYTMMPGVCAEFATEVRCNFCKHMGVLGTPLVVLRHVCTSRGDEQRVQVLVSRVCGTCARKRCTVSGSLRRYSALFIQEQITKHVTYTMQNTRHQLATLRVDVAEEQTACDECYKVINLSSDDYLAVVARRADDSEHAVFIACSDNCRTQIRESVRRTDFQVGQWTVLDDADTTAVLEDRRPGAMLVRGRDLVLHSCKSEHCFCYSTHRGGFARHVAANAPKPRATVLSSSSARVDSDLTLRLIYNGLTRVYLYIDLLGTESSTRCVHCKKPAERVCNVCWAVRTCSDACRDATRDAHAKSCRPYGGTWTPLLTL